jgi:HAD superfamily hydrolase (TIGR01509 family)
MSAVAVAWDIDGTLADSEDLHHRALVQSAAQFGVDLSDLPNRAFSGVHMPNVWRALSDRLPHGLAERELLAAVEDFYTAESRTIVALAGAVETIAELDALGVRQVCVSNSSRRIVDANLAALGVKRHIAFSVSLDDVSLGKPDPEPYRLACERLGLGPSQVLAVEDSETGAQSAHAAGLFVIGFAPLTAGPRASDVLIRDLPEVLHWASARLERSRRETRPRAGRDHGL